MNYPTVKEQGLFRSALMHAADIADMIEHVDTGGWIIDSTELLEYVVQVTGNLQDAVLALIMEQTKEEGDGNA